MKALRDGAIGLWWQTSLLQKVTRQGIRVRSGLVKVAPDLPGRGGARGRGRRRGAGRADPGHATRGRRGPAAWAAGASTGLALLWAEQIDRAEADLVPVLLKT